MNKSNPNGIHNTSDFGDGPEDRYLVRDSATAALQTGCFVLRPGRDKLAYEVLVIYNSKLQPDDPRKEVLSNWLERLKEMYKDRV